MNKKTIKIAVIGAGAIGGITAAWLSKAGYDVELVCKHRETANIANDIGLLIKGVRGEQRIKVRAVAEIEELSGEKDIIMVAVKAYDMPEAVRKALPFLKPDTLVVSMQNGICTDTMAQIVGAERTVGCVIGWGATMLDKAVLDWTSEGEFVIGGITKGMDDRLSDLKQVLESVIPTRISGDITSELIINSCITSMGVLSGLTLGDMMKSRKARNIFLAIVSEAIAVAGWLGITVPPYGGKLDYYALAESNGWLGALKNHLVIRVVGFKYRRLKSSSLQSLLRGKPTEIDYFNGYIASKGAEAGVKTPVNTAIVKMIKEIEAGSRNPDPANFSAAEFGAVR